MNRLELEWMAGGLQVPCLTTGTEGLELNRAAERALADGDEPHSLQEAILLVLQSDADASRFEGLVAAAASKGSASCRMGKWGVCAQHAGGRTAIMLVPMQTQAMSDVFRRAAASENISGVAHEIANALSAIVGWAQLSEEQPSSAPPTKALRAIRSSARAAERMARGLLHMSRPARTSEPCDVTAAVREAVDALEPQARRARIELTLKTGDSAFALADAADLFTISWNLIKNALEATELVPVGSRHVEVHVAKGQGRVQIVVADSGPGLAGRRDSEPFAYGFTSKARGAGIGLSLAREAARGHGGDIATEVSALGGALFRVSLPGTQQIKPESRPATRPSWVPAPAGFRVLVIDDDDSLRELIATTLRIRDAEVLALASLEELDPAETAFDLCFIDLGAHPARGDSSLAELRARGVGGYAVLMSGAPPPSDLNGDARMDEWLSKPFDLDDLHRIMRHTRDSKV